MPQTARRLTPRSARRADGRGAPGTRPPAAALPPPFEQPELPEQLGDARGRDPARQVPQPRREAQVLLHREIAVQRRLLEDEADAATGLEVIAYDVVSGDTRRAPSGTQQRGEQMDGGRLTGAVGPEEPEELALPHLEVEVVERADRAEVFAEAAGFDRGGGHSCAAR